MAINNLTNPGMEPQAGDLIENTEATTPEESVAFVMGANPSMSDQMAHVVEKHTEQMQDDHMEHEESLEVIKERIRQRAQELSDKTRGTSKLIGRF